MRLLVPANPLYLPIPSLNNPSAYPLEKYRMAISASGLEAQSFSAFLILLGVTGFAMAISNLFPSALLLLSSSPVSTSRESAANSRENCSLSPVACRATGSTDPSRGACRLHPPGKCREFPRKWSTFPQVHFPVPLSPPFSSRRSFRPPFFIQSSGWESCNSDRKGANHST